MTIKQTNKSQKNEKTGTRKKSAICYRNNS